MVVLVAVDRAQSLPALVSTALRFSVGRDPRVSVLHVVGSLESDRAVRHPGRWLVPEFRNHMLHATRREFEQALPPGIETSVHVVAGRPDARIAHRARELGASLVVIGASRRFMHVGSNAARLLRRSHGPLRVVPADAMVQAAGVDGTTSTRVA